MINGISTFLVWFFAVALSWAIIAVFVWFLAVMITIARADQYGFTHPPYNYADEYRANQWKCSEEHRYQPGYHRCSGDEQPRRHKEDKE